MTHFINTLWSHFPGKYYVKVGGGTGCANAPMQFNSFEKIWEHSVVYLLDSEQHGWKIV